MARHIRPLLLFACLTLGAALPLQGQGLDIGGIGIRLGQDVAEALRALSSYEVQYSEAMHSWTVSQEVGGMHPLLGIFSAVNGKISYIHKAYDIPEAADLPEVYARALKDAKRLGGPSCSTEPVLYSDDLVHSIETTCGRYKLTLMLPSHSMGHDTVASLGLTIRATP